jgi:hypothetical protein
MLSWSARRRIGYFAFVIAVLAVLGSAVYVFYKPAPSCFDGKQNGNELGIDCGGSCARVCPLEVVPLQVLWSRLFTISPGVNGQGGNYDVAALLKNPNLHHGTGTFPYTFKIWDEAGVLLSTRKGSAWLNPGEQLVVFEPRVAVGTRAPARVDFEISAAPVWQKITGELPILTIGKKNFTNLPTPRLDSSIKNDSLQSLGGFDVVAVLSDENENAVAVSSTYVESLASGATAPPVFTWPAPIATPVTFIDLYPHLKR